MSYQQLLNIMKQSAQEVVDEKSRPPVACPNDGQPLLRSVKSGQLYCPFDGWVWSGIPTDK